MKKQTAKALPITPIPPNKLARLTKTSPAPLSLGSVPNSKTKVKTTSPIIRPIKTFIKIIDKVDFMIFVSSSILAEYVSTTQTPIERLKKLSPKASRTVLYEIALKSGLNKNKKASLNPFMLKLYKSIKTSKIKSAGIIQTFIFSIPLLMPLLTTQKISKKTRLKQMI